MKNIADPVDNQDAVSKNFLDGIITQNIASNTSFPAMSVPVMGDFTVGDYTVSASSWTTAGTGYETWKAFDNQDESNTTTWSTISGRYDGSGNAIVIPANEFNSTGVYGDWIQMSMTTLRGANTVRMRGYPPHNPWDQFPAEVVFLTSEDGVAWTQRATHALVFNSTTGWTSIVSIATLGGNLAFRHIACVFPKSTGLVINVTRIDITGTSFTQVVEGGAEIKNGTALIPLVTDVCDLGSNVRKFKGLYLSGTPTDDNHAATVGYVDGKVIDVATNTTDIGTNTTNIGTNTTNIGTNTTNIGTNTTNIGTKLPLGGGTMTGDIDM